MQCEFTRGRIYNLVLTENKCTRSEFRHDENHYYYHQWPHSFIQFECTRVALCLVYILIKVEIQRHGTQYVIISLALFTDFSACF